MKSRARTIAYILAAASFVAAFAWLLRTHGPLAPVNVAMGTVTRADVTPSVFGIGVVEARRAYAVGPIQPGRVSRVLVDEGEVVAAGQLLAEIDPLDLDQRLLGAASAEGRASQAVHAAEALAKEAASRASLTGRNRDRDLGLYEGRVISEAAREASAHEALAAASALAVARANVQAATKDLARVRADLQAIERVRDSLKLVSPVDGVVVAREAEPGSTVVGGQAVLRLVEPSSLWVRARVDQARAGALREGQPATIVLRSSQDVDRPGRVARIERQSDPVTEERIVDVSFEPRPEDLFLGELAEVTIAEPSLVDALTVPGAAVAQVAGETGVWRVVEGQARFTTVQVGRRGRTGEREVLSGLAEGDRVVVHSSALLKNGTRVREQPVRP
jgi:HlyD family secretion protein